MSEVKDPKIKLFGKTIELQETSGAAAPAAAQPVVEGGEGRSCDSGAAAGEDSLIQDRPCCSNSMVEDRNLNRDTEDREADKDLSVQNQDDTNHEDLPQPMVTEELKNSEANPSANDDPPSPSADNNAAAASKTSRTEEDQTETSNSQEKTLKKPDKIIPCPRCNSMDTKFCYFNNYNVNQPRHFCKNCQRYWTAGGTMRNVPVGAGRRKNKNAAAHFRHLTIPENALQSSRPELHPNGAVLTFTSDTPLCESMASVLNIADKSIRKNGFHVPEELVHGSKVNVELSGSSINAGGSKDKAVKTGVPEPVVLNGHNFPPGMPCYPGPAWPYPWNSVQWAPPNFGPASFPVPFYSTGPGPGPYWGCAAVPGTWNVPWIIPPSHLQNGMVPGSGLGPGPGSGPNSPTLGKHSRDDNVIKHGDWKEEETQKESDPEKCLWVPKTLRIDDPGEAARSSIWATLGIKNDRADSVGGGGLFKAFQTQAKDNEKTHISESSTVLQANPAALSRSQNFRESS